MAIVHLQSALAALAGKLRQAKTPGQALAVVARLERQNGIEPGFSNLMMDDGIERAVKKDASADAGEGPEAVGRHGAAAEEFEHRLAELLFQLEIDAFEAGSR